MSARVESPQIRSGYLVGPVVMALLVALTFGALAGSLVTRSIVGGDDRSPVAPEIEASAQTLDAWPGRVLVATPFGSATTWDIQKLEAMAGRATAEQFRDTVVLSAAELNLLRQGVVPERLRGEQDSAVVLTAAELIALRNGELAERLQRDPVLWDTQKLEAMEGRVLAAQAGAEDPPVKPHLPKRPPSG
jgi:hypothetical protein